MLRITVDVNGYPVSQMFIHNTARIDQHGRHLYDAALWDSERGEGWFGIEHVAHYRHDPWWALVSAVQKAL